MNRQSARHAPRRVLASLTGRRDAYPRLRAVARRLGYHLVRADYYSPIPDRWSPMLWENPAPMAGVDLRLTESIALLRELAPFIVEYAPPGGPPGTKHGYYHLNGFYPQTDAEVLFAMIRRARPRRVIEIGAGWSSRVIADALDQNSADGATAEEHRAFDPFPTRHLRSLDVPVEAVAAQEIPLPVFAGLGAGDVLFIDTTHTVKPGNDVVRLVLEVLPALAPGVLVHIHDVFLPFSYPEFMFRGGVFWQEQYLVQAFLAFNPRFEVVIANHALPRLRGPEVESAVPGLSSHVPGSALWLRSTGEDQP